MVLDMKVNGLRAKSRAKENFIIRMETITKDNSLIRSIMGKEHSSALIDQLIKDIGTQESNQDTENMNGPIELAIKANSKMARRMEKGSSSGRILVITMGFGFKM